MENSKEVFQKIKNRITLWCWILDMCSRELKAGSWRDICTHVLTAALVIVGRTQKQSKCPLMDEWRRKMWLYIQWNITQPLKGRKFYNMLQDKWTLRTPRLSDMSFPQRQCLIHLYEVFRVITPMQIGEWWLLGVRGRQNWELLDNRHRIPVLQDEKSDGSGWWGWIHNLNVLESAELCT